MKQDSYLKKKSNPISSQRHQELIESYRQSLKLYALQVSGLQNALDEKNVLIQEMITSRSWKVTLFLRKIFQLVRGNVSLKYSIHYIKKRLLEIYKEEGIKGIYNRLVYLSPNFRKIIQKIPQKHQKTSNSNKLENHIKTDSIFSNLDKILGYKFTEQTSNTEYPLVLIVAEVTLPQCYKYRVQQKAEHLERLGWFVKIVDWREQKSVLSFLQICTEVIFYRVPSFPNVIEQIAEAKRLALNPWWEVDDLIIDEQRYAECGFMIFLSQEERDLLFFGTDLYRKTMFACNHAIASTQALAKVMHDIGVPETYVIENALDQDTLRIAEKFYPVKKSKRNNEKKTDEIIVLYGSGTNTHNADFLVASIGILEALRLEPKLQFWIVGELDLPVEYQELIGQIKYIPPQSYESYLELLADADIAIAPLEPILFNDAKSNIKYLEASILGIASVCSPRQAFKEVIFDGKNGFLANTKEEWKDKILLLARDPQLRVKIGKQAYLDVRSHYSPENITEKQVKQIFPLPIKTSKEKKKLKILVVNVYYDPYSFGGATFVAEEMAQHLHQYDEVEVSVFTTRPPRGDIRGLCKYQSHGITVYSVDLMPTIHITHQFDNIDILESYDMVLDAVHPDIVHFHAIQNMGLQMLFTCQSKQIPYVITLHDSWWLCSRQFMVRSNGQYCGQKNLDLKACQACEPHARHLTERMIMMKQVLGAASLLLSPSETHRQLYIANAIDEDLIKVNRNGIIRPKKKRPQRPHNTPLRFGFVAGDEVIKGALVVQQAFKSLSRADWELKIIDSKVNMGFPPIDVDSWNVKGKVVTIPPYNDQSIDDFFFGIDILLFPSQCKESYGMTVREALLRDVWVICSHPGGQSEDVIDGVNGNYISLTGDIEELKRVIEELLDKASMFDTYINPHKEHIATLEEQADELLGYYRQVKEVAEKEDQYAL